MPRISPREAIAHILPTHDRELADRAIAQLEECGYRIVEKPQASEPPDVPANIVPRHPDADALRHEMALT